MNWVDFWVVLIVALLLGLVIFFHFVYPRLTHQGSFEARLKKKRLLRDYRKAKAKEEKENKK
jgi:uncharacterized membrane-anchored protein YhcB (DUF1043 family)